MSVLPIHLFLSRGLRSGNSIRGTPFGGNSVWELHSGKQIPSRRAAGVCDVLRPIYFKIFMSVLPIHLSPFRELRSGEQIPSRRAAGFCDVLRPI